MGQRVVLDFVAGVSCVSQAVHRPDESAGFGCHVPGGRVLLNPVSKVRTGDDKCSYVVMKELGGSVSVKPSGLSLSA